MQSVDARVKDQHLSASRSPKGGCKVLYPWPLPGPDVPQQLGLLGLCGRVVVPDHGHGAHWVLVIFIIGQGRAGQRTERRERTNKGSRERIERTEGRESKDMRDIIQY